ncbi:hypothetical protein BGY98DRAFT_1191206, partial [Russula aff. rugulosa BPL654]
MLFLSEPSRPIATSCPSLPYISHSHSDGLSIRWHLPSYNSYLIWQAHQHQHQCHFRLFRALAQRWRSLPVNKSHMHATLSSWLKNIYKLEGLTNRLQDLASSAPKNCRSQLFNKVVALRATLEKQQDRCAEILRLSEDYADKYLLGIDAEIQQQSTLLGNLEERLEASKKLHGDADDLQMYFESETVASMNDLRAPTGKAVP